MVTPFSRSKSMESRICSVVSRSGTVPVKCNNRSAKVDLPWSIWAMMQKLRIWEVIPRKVYLIFHLREVSL